MNSILYLLFLLPFINLVSFFIHSLFTIIRESSILINSLITILSNSLILSILAYPLIYSLGLFSFLSFLFTIPHSLLSLGTSLFSFIPSLFLFVSSPFSILSPRSLSFLLPSSSSHTVLSSSLTSHLFFSLLSIIDPASTLLAPLYPTVQFSVVNLLSTNTIRYLLSSSSSIFYSEAFIDTAPLCLPNFSSSFRVAYLLM